MKVAKINPRWRLLLCFGGVGAAVVLAVVANPAAVPAYTPYLSPPLSDGTRYAFQCPAYLNNITIRPGNGGGSIQYVYFSRRASVAETMTPNLLKAQLSPLFPTLYPSTGEEVVVAVIKRSSTEYQGNDHREDNGAEEGNAYHRIYLGDARVKWELILLHRSGTRSQPPPDSRAIAAFGRSDGAIAGSFRLLPPKSAGPVRDFSSL